MHSTTQLNKFFIDLSYLQSLLNSETCFLNDIIYLAIMQCFLSQPILQYASAFDDEVQDTQEEVVEEMTNPSVPEAAEEMPEGDVEDLPIEETPQSSQTAHHGPYYYFYQGMCWFVCNDEMFCPPQL